MMKTSEAYAMGWVYGYLYREMRYPMDYDPSGKKFEDSGFNPFTGFALIHQEASRRGILTEEVTKTIAEAVADVAPVESEYRAPIPLVGSWQLGYYAALNGRPIPSGGPDIAALRKEKGLTQAQLAGMVGCDQTIISRWERKQSTPSKEIQNKIMAVLDSVAVSSESFRDCKKLQKIDFPK